MYSVQHKVDGVQYVVMPANRSPGQRAGLSREQVLGAALAVLRSDGLDAVTMRRIAAELEVAPNALYSHVPDKAALLDGLLDLVLAEVRLPERGGWRARVEAMLTDARRVLLEHPDLIPSFLARQTTESEHALRLGEAVLAQLARGGIEGEQAVRALQVLLVHTIGSAAFDAPRRRDPDPVARAARARAAASGLDLAGFPRTRALAAGLAHHPGDAVFAAGLRWILDGLAADASGAGGLAGAR